MPVNVASLVLPGVGKFRQVTAPADGGGGDKSVRIAQGILVCRGPASGLAAGPGKGLSGRGFSRSPDGVPAVQEILTTPLGTGPPLRADERCRGSLPAAHALS